MFGHDGNNATTPQGDCSAHNPHDREILDAVTFPEGSQEGELRAAGENRCVVGSTPVVKEVARIVVFGVISYSPMPEFPLVD